MWCAFVVNRGLTTRLWSINIERDKEKEWEQTECRFHTSSIIIISMPYSHITFLEEFAGNDWSKYSKIASKFTCPECVVKEVWVRCETGEVTGSTYWLRTAVSHVSGKEEHQFVPDALSRLCVNNVPPSPTLVDKMIVALRPVMVGWYPQLNQQHIKQHFKPNDMISDHMISKFLRQCSYCQIMNRLWLPMRAHRFTYASYNPFEVLHLDHIGELFPSDSFRDSVGHAQSYRSLESFIPTKDLLFIMS